MLRNNISNHNDIDLKELVDFFCPQKTFNAEEINQFFVDLEKKRESETYRKLHLKIEGLEQAAFTTNEVIYYAFLTHDLTTLNKTHFDDMNIDKLDIPLAMQTSLIGMQLALRYTNAIKYKQREQIKLFIAADIQHHFINRKTLAEKQGLCFLNLSNINLSEIDLTECYFNFCSLKQAKLEQCDLSHTDFSFANLDEIDLTHATNKHGNAIFNASSAQKAMLFNGKLDIFSCGTNFSNSNFSESTILINGKHSDFNNCDFYNANFVIGKIFENMHFINADFHKCQFPEGLSIPLEGIRVIYQNNLLYEESYKDRLTELENNLNQFKDQPFYRRTREILVKLLAEQIGSYISLLHALGSISGCSPKTEMEKIERRIGYQVIFDMKISILLTLSKEDLLKRLDITINHPLFNEKIVDKFNHSVKFAQSNLLLLSKNQMPEKTPLEILNNIKDVLMGKTEIEEQKLSEEEPTHSYCVLN